MYPLPVFDNMMMSVSSRLTDIIILICDGVRSGGKSWSHCVKWWGRGQQVFLPLRKSEDQWHPDKTMFLFFPQTSAVTGLSGWKLMSTHLFIASKIHPISHVSPFHTVLLEILLLLQYQEPKSYQAWAHHMLGNCFTLRYSAIPRLHDAFAF